MITIYVDKLPPIIGQKSFKMKVPEIPRKGDYIRLDDSGVYAVEHVIFYRADENEGDCTVSVSVGPKAFDV